MTNTPSDPVSGAGAASSVPIRDLAAINDSVEAAEQARWDRSADDMETYTLDRALLLAPALYLITLVVQKTDLSIFAYGLWALAVLFWTPWLILRVDSRRPPGDTAKAAAFLGYAMLGWPLSVAVIELVPTRFEFVLAFPVVFFWSVGFAALGVWPRPRPPASPRRARMLAGGATAYLACALLLAGPVAGAGAGLWRPPELGDLEMPAVILTLVLASFVALPGVVLLRVAWQTWRKTRTA